jgi:hypothetical protein
LPGLPGFGGGLGFGLPGVPGFPFIGATPGAAPAGPPAFNPFDPAGSVVNLLGSVFGRR